MVVDIRIQKVVRDLWENKTRTILVALAIAVGVFAFGVVGSSRIVLQASLTSAYESSNPADAIMYVTPFDDSLVDFVRGLREVSDADGRRETSVNIEDVTGDRDTFYLYAIPDFDNAHVAKVTPETGSWPPQRREVLLERSDYNIAEFPTGDTIHIELPDGTPYDLQVVGTVHDISKFPAQNYNEGYGYITLDTLSWMTGGRYYNRLLIRLEDTSNRRQVEQTVTKVRERIENEGYVVSSVEIPRGHWGMNIVLTIAVVLGVIGTFSLLLSGLLVLNTVSALLQQQIKQIGILKTIGARSKQLMGVYLSTILVYGLLAISISIPLGVVGAQGFCNLVAQTVNFDVVNMSLSPPILLLQIFVGLIVPVVAAIAPILNGTRIPAREAIYDQKSNDALLKKGLADGLFEQIRGLPRPLMLSLRNTFRRKGRLRLTMGTLVVASAVFIAIFSVRSGLFAMVGNIFSLLDYDAHVDVAGYHRVELLEREAMRIDGVVDAEAWNIGRGQQVRDDGSEGPNIIIYGIPPDSSHTSPVVTQGRWINPGDVSEVALTEDMLNNDPDLHIGSQITLRIGDEEETLTVVGAVSPLGSPQLEGFAYVTDEFYQRHWAGMRMANRVVVETEKHTAAFQARVANDLSDHYKDVVGLEVIRAVSMVSFQNGISANFNIIVGILFAISLLLALVGGLGLTGTMSLNVLERTREIGVMRAVGASNRSVWMIVVVEGILICLMSSALGAMLAYPIGRALNAAVGVAFINGPLEYYYSVSGAFIWLIFSIILAVVSCWLPAWNAVRISVRESLAYE